MIEALRDPLAGDRAPESKGELSVAQARAVVQDLFEHSARIYWTDFLLCLSVAYGAVALYLSSPIFSARYLIGFTIAAFALFRCGVFIHEIAHMPGKRMRLFRAVKRLIGRGHHPGHLLPGQHIRKVLG